MWSFGDPATAEQLAELLRPEEVALDLVLQVGLPVEPDRARDVGLRVQGGVLVDLDDADGVVVEVVLDPVGLDEHVLRVIGHGRRLLAGTGETLSTFGGKARIPLAPSAQQRPDRLPRGLQPRAAIGRVGVEQRERDLVRAVGQAQLVDPAGQDVRTDRAARPRRRRRARSCRSSSRASCAAASRAGRRPAHGRRWPCPAATAAPSRCPARSAACRSRRGRRSSTPRRRPRSPAAAPRCG